MTLTEATAECDLCGETIYRYCHSQAGALKAYAWSDIDPDGDEDPRYGTQCLHAYELPGTHRPASDEEDEDA